MDVLISDPVPAMKQIQVRASRLTILNPVAGDVNIRFTGEKQCILDGAPIAALPCPDVIRNLMGVATEVKTITDPVTGQQVSISVAGVADVIVRCFLDWYAEDEAVRNAPTPPPAE